MCDLDAEVEYVKLILQLITTAQTIILCCTNRRDETIQAPRVLMHHVKSITIW